MLLTHRWVSFYELKLFLRLYEFDLIYQSNFLCLLDTHFWRMFKAALSEFVTLIKAVEASLNTVGSIDLNLLWLTSRVSGCHSDTKEGCRKSFGLASSSSIKQLENGIAANERQTKVCAFIFYNVSSHRKMERLLSFAQCSTLVDQTTTVLNHCLYLRMHSEWAPVIWSVLLLIWVNDNRFSTLLTYPLCIQMNGLSEKRFKATVSESQFVQPNRIEDYLAATWSRIRLGKGAASERLSSSIFTIFWAKRWYRTILAIHQNRPAAVAASLSGLCCAMLWQRWPATEQAAPTCWIGPRMDQHPCYWRIDIAAAAISQLNACDECAAWLLSVILPKSYTRTRPQAAAPSRINEAIDDADVADRMQQRLLLLRNMHVTWYQDGARFD